MASTDPELGKKIAAHLASKKVETPIDFTQSLVNTEYTKSYQARSIKEAFECTLEELRLNLKDDSIKDTPDRVSKMYCEEIFNGLNYDNFPKCTTFANSSGNNELVISKGAVVLSMCEHHLLPFFGKACIGYIPDKQLLGLSKLNRVVDFFSRRPQVQERLGQQIFHALSYILATDDVAITIEAEHMCMRFRGIQQAGTSTVTSFMGGRFMAKPELRQEFLNLTRG